MKTGFNAISKFLIVAAISAAPLFAQAGNGQTFTTSFPFYVGNQQMPAGSYTVTTPDTANDLLFIQDASRTHAAFIEYNRSETAIPASQGYASFNELGGVAFLNAITETGQTSGIELPAGNREKETALTQREQATNLSVPLGTSAAGI